MYNVYVGNNISRYTCKEVNSSNNLSYTPQSYTVKDFPPSRPNWVPLLPLPQASVAPSPFGSKGETHSLTLLLSVYYYTSTIYPTESKPPNPPTGEGKICLVRWNYLNVSK